MMCRDKQKSSELEPKSEFRTVHKIKKICSYETHMTSRMGNRTENVHFITFVTLKHPNDMHWLFAYEQYS